jgi:hypothetical protein
MPGRFVLGVECDGAAYHSSKVARDRDRVREEVLRRLGWKLFRIWGLGWYRDRERQEERLRNAIQSAIASPGPEVTPHGKDDLGSPDIELDEFDFDGPPPWTSRYVPAKAPPARTNLPMHEHAAAGELRRLISEVVKVERAVHEERVLRAVREAWGVGRASDRMRQAFSRAVRQLSETITRDSKGFLRLVNDGAFDAVRIPSSEDDDVRGIFEVPPEEIEHALERLVDDAHAITQDDLTTTTARLFGWRRRGSDIQTALDRSVDRLVERGRLVRENNLLRSSPTA